MKTFGSLDWSQTWPLGNLNKLQGRPNSLTTHYKIFFNNSQK